MDNLNNVSEYSNIVLDVSDSKEEFVRKFCNIYNYLEYSKQVVPILYKNRFIYIVNLISCASLENKEKEYFYLTVIFPNRSLCFAHENLLGLSSNLHKLLKYFQAKVSLNSTDYICNFSALNISNSFSGFYSKSTFRVENG